MGTGLSFQPWSTKFRSFLSRLPSADLTGEAQPNFHELHHQDEETNMAMSNGNFFSTEVHLQLWLNWPPRLALGNSLYAKGTVPLNLNIFWFESVISLKMPFLNYQQHPCFRIYWLKMNKVACQLFPTSPENLCWLCPLLCETVMSIFKLQLHISSLCAFWAAQPRYPDWHRHAELRNFHWSLKRLNTDIIYMWVVEAPRSTNENKAFPDHPAALYIRRRRAGGA